MLGKLIEAAMAQAVADTSQACEAIWASDLPPDEKNAKIAALTHPDNVRARMLAYRAAIRTKWRERENARNTTTEAVATIRKESGAEARAE